MKINDPDFMVAFLLMESEDYLSLTHNWGHGVECVCALCAISHPRESNTSTRGHRTIYGYGGYHRYLLKIETGEVLYSRYHGPQQAADALAVGFALF